jgi:predicted permease
LMSFVMSDCLADLFTVDVARLRLAAMFIVLAGGIVSGYLAGNRLGLPEYWAKRIMTAVLVSFNWLIAMLVIWRMRLSSQLIWVPVVGVILMLAVTGFSAGLFYLFEPDRKSRLTLILAGGLSNLGYTGGAFVCYALFGADGLGIANIYPLLWVPAVYLIFFPLLKVREIWIESSCAKFKLRQVLDFRFLAFPAVIGAIVLNLINVKIPAFIAEFHIIDIFVYIASSLSFFAIGLRVSLPRLKNYMSLYFLLGAVKFVLTPAVAFLIVWLLTLSGRGLSDLAQKVIIVLSVTPSAVAVVTMSNVFDLDAPLASALWVVNMATFVLIVVPLLFFIFA